MARKAAQKKPRAPQPRAADGTFAKASASIAPGMDAVRRAASPTDQVMAAWNPSLTDPNSDWAWERTPAVARTRDLVANNPYAAAAVNKAVAMQVGVSLRYSPRHELMARRLGIDVDAASELATQIQTAFESWACDPLFRCDWERDQDFGGLVNLAARHKFIDGEALAVMRWDEAPLGEGWRWRGALQVIDPDRLSNPFDRMSDAKLVNGVETDGRCVVAYHVRDGHPADRLAWGRKLRWERIPARQPWGRPIVLHLRAKGRAGERRGISKFVACLRVFKQLDKFTDSELSNAAMNALFGATIKTAKTSGEAMEALGVAALGEVMETRKEWYKGVDPRLSNGARVAVLAPGDEMDLNASPRAAAAFEAFLNVGLRGCASALGLSGSQLTMDFSKTNFSSWRGEMLDVWRGVLEDRAVITTQFCNPAALCVIEEGIDRGEITPPAGCPGLYENPAGWLAGRWIGPSRGTIDPTGEVDGANKRVAGGYSTLEDEALELGGNDYEAVAGQAEFEAELWKSKGLTPTAFRELTGMSAPLGAPAPNTPTNPSPDDPSADGAEEGDDPATDDKGGAPADAGGKAPPSA